ncbi:hypothetical protein BpHYR1_002272 [Brachionus plicatilis]|uniref:Uncharacterized protein n=1 Tax=Brachionus plicatilis TaxID=10195 RepID=A0A3M7Q7K9_BRAPC|nr:hypothetical protein BpHYR1_002272 [Brachionus plicatilis]
MIRIIQLVKQGYSLNKVMGISRSIGLKNREELLPYKIKNNIKYNNLKSFVNFEKNFGQLNKIIKESFDKCNKQECNICQFTCLFLCFFAICNFTPLMFFINSPHKSHGTGFRLLFRQLFTTRMVHLKPQVYVRPCTKYPTHGIKACVAKQANTVYPEWICPNFCRKYIPLNILLVEHDIVAYLYGSNYSRHAFISPTSSRKICKKLTNTKINFVYGKFSYQNKI